MNKLETIDKLLIKTAAQDKTGFGEKILCLSVCQNWEKIAGELSKKISPIKIQNKTLFISAENPAVKDNVKFLAKDFVEKINEVVGHGEKIVEKISFGKNFEVQKKIPQKISVEEVHDEKIFSAENLEKIILTDEEIFDCEKKSAAVNDENFRQEVKEIFIARKKLEKLKIQNGWHKCKICGELCKPSENLCDFCKINERDKMRARIRKIFYDKPATKFLSVQKKIFQEMPHMKKDCTLSVIESEYSSLIRETAARVSFGDKKSDAAKFLVMLFKQTDEKNLSDALIEKALHELRFNLADRTFEKKQEKKIVL